MSYILAPKWKGQVLRPGALGYPASHPNVYSYARPKYYAGRGFAGLGDSAPWTPTCNPGTVDACNFSDWLFGTSAACAAGLNACFYASQAPGASGGINLVSTPPGAGPISTPTLIQQTAVPTGSNVAPDAAAALLAYQQSVAAANPPAVSLSDSIPTWVWAVVAGLGLLAVAR